MTAIIRKELADFFNSMRFMILFLLVLGMSALALYSAFQGIRGSGTEGFLFLRLYTTPPSGMDIEFAYFFTYINFIPLIFVPLVGALLGFDAINKERTTGTLSRIISQPVHRDSVINSKFLASLIILAIMMATSILLIGGYGLRMIGVPPTAEEVIRLFVYFIGILIYGTFWIAFAMLFSVVFRNLATSIIFSMVLWLFFSFGMYFIAKSTAGDVDTFRQILSYSPSWIFGQASSTVLYPAVRTLGTLTMEQSAYMVPNPLSLGQSLMVIWPYMVGLISLSAIFFAVSYIVFMKQEVRPT
jgi:ABC-2 type transport system permease protein